MRSLSVDNHKMAASLRLGSFLRSGVRTTLLASRAYSNGGSTLPLTFGSSTEVFYNNVDVKQVDVSSTTGTFGILPNHVPAISVLKPGLVVVHDQDDKQNKFFASSGTVTINADSTVQILVEEAYPLDKLDAQAARSGLEKCQAKVSSATSEEERAEAQVGVELYETLVKSLEG